MTIRPPLASFHWDPAWRLAPNRPQPVNLFARVANTNELHEVLAIEHLTNARMRDEIRRPRLVPESERQSGPNSALIMANFTHIGLDGNPFSNGDYGLYYAAKSLETAVAEARYHRERFLQYTNERPINICMRSYASMICTQLHDIRGMQTKMPTVFDESSYTDSQSLALDLRCSGSNGLIFDSARHTGGECMGIFKAKIPRPLEQSNYYCFQWNGQSIFNIYQNDSG